MTGIHTTDLQPTGLPGQASPGPTARDASARPGTLGDAGRDGSEASDVRVTLVTAPDMEVARRIARALVDERLAACVNLVPGLVSVFRWEGAVQEDAEVLLIVKSRAKNGREVSERVRALHPYDLPEVLELPAVGGSPEYLDWVRSEVAP